MDQIKEKLRGYWQSYDRNENNVLLALLVETLVEIGFLIEENNSKQ